MAVCRTYASMISAARRTLENAFMRYGYWLLMLAVGLLQNVSAAIGQDMALSQFLVEGAGWELVAEGFGFTEGPAIDAEGRLYFTDVPKNRIYRLDDAGKAVVF